MSELLKCEIDNKGIATVTLNRPNVHNAFNPDLINKLKETFKELTENDNVLVAVLKGEGKSFCAGADITWMKEMKNYSVEENIEDSENLASLFHELNNFPKPLIGSIHGAVLGGGTGLVCVCDFVIADQSTLFGFTETKLGLVPATISPFIIAKIGVSNARAWFISGAKFNAATAKDMGLVHEISNNIDESLEKLCAEFLTAAPCAAKHAKELITHIIDKDIDKELMECTSKLIAEIRTGDEAQEGMSALLEKRKPKWVND